MPTWIIKWMPTWLPIIISIFSLLVSIGSVIFNIVQYTRDHAKLNVSWDDKTRWSYGLFDRSKGKTIAGIENGQQEFEIRVVNPSNYDIGYFDFRVFNPESKNEELSEVYYSSPAQFNKINNTEDMNVDMILLPKGESRFPIVLPSEHGIFPAHQETVLAVVLDSAQTPLKSVCFVFKIAKKRGHFSNQNWSYAFSKFQSYSGEIKINSENKPDYKSLKKRLDEIRKNETNDYNDK